MLYCTFTYSDWQKAGTSSILRLSNKMIYLTVRSLANLRTRATKHHTTMWLRPWPSKHHLLDPQPVLGMIWKSARPQQSWNSSKFCCSRDFPSCKANIWRRYHIKQQQQMFQHLKLLFSYRIKKINRCCKIRVILLNSVIHLLNVAWSKVISVNTYA